MTTYIVPDNPTDVATRDRDSSGGRGSVSPWQPGFEASTGVRVSADLLN